MPEQGLLFEHINLNVPDVELARAFYVRGLGGVENPQGTNARQLHVNIGVSQLHLPFRLSVSKNEPVVTAQVWPGEIVLLSSEDLETVRARVAKVCPRAAAKCEGDELHCRCPWGNLFVLQRAPLSFEVAGQHTGGHAGLVAMPTAVLRVPAQTVLALARFYSEVLGCSTHLAGSVCDVLFDGGQKLRFRESTDAPPADAYDHDEAAAFHVCLYLRSAAAFADAFARTQAAGLLYVNPRFEGGPPEFASASTWDEASACGQFRVKDLRDGAALGLVLEHEIRTPAHRSCPIRRPKQSLASVPHVTKSLRG